MKQVLLFPEFDQEQLNYEKIFLTVISYDRPDFGKFLSSLSPKIMHWKTGVWIVDLGYCSSYWKTLAIQSYQECRDIWKSMLQEIFPSGTYYGGLGFHPWQSLLLAYTLEEAGMKGLIHIDSVQGKNIYPHISWASWWRSAEEYDSHKKALTKKEVSTLSQQIKKMRLSMKRLGCTQPLHMSHTSPLQMKRRFGSDIETLWSWTYRDNKNKMIDSLDFQMGFPWTDYTSESKPEVRRNLDHSSFNWDEIEYYLADDLNKLCFSPSFNEGEHIMSLEWRLVLHDLTEVPIQIKFRNPHNLHDESPHQRTALLQIQYQFKQSQKVLSDRYRELDDLPPSIVSWSLIIHQKLLRNSTLQNLFDNHCKSSKDIFKLENQVATPLLSYKTVDHWIPEESYTKTTHGSHDKALSQIHILNKRPLFTYGKPQRFQQSQSSGSWKFTERTMDKWWHSRSRNIRRDYYHYTSNDQRYWVFRTGQGDWYIHGIFA